MTTRQILVVDDEIGIRELLRDVLQDEGYHVRLAENAAQARALRQQERPDLVLLDIWMPDCDGISLLREWGQGGLLTMPVVMMSGHGTIDTAVEATRIGAFDYLEKPVALQKLLKTVGAALRHAEQMPRSSINLFGLGKSQVMIELRQRLERLSGVHMPVLLSGPGGCGSELCARFLHQPDTPWLELSQPEKLANAPVELLEQVRDGLVFIPIFDTLGRTEQKGLLFLLSKAEKYAVRVVCASRMTLFDLGHTGQFEEALLQALSRASLQIPPLSGHREDIPDLVQGMTTLLAEGGAVPYREFDVAALNALRNAEWPGNLDQLKSVVQNLMATALGDKVTLPEVERVLSQFVPAEALPPETPQALPLDLDQPLRDVRDAFECLYFEHQIARAGGNMSKVAEIAGLERTHLYRKLKQLGIKVKAG